MGPQMPRVFLLNAPDFDRLFTQLTLDIDNLRTLNEQPSRLKLFGRWLPSLPSPDYLRRVVETAFWATLEREEGRFHGFRLTCRPPGDDEIEFRFKRSLYLSSRELSKLASSVLEEALIGTWIDEGGIYSWGFSHLPDASIQVRARRPGQLLLGIAGYPSAVVTAERIELVDAERLKLAAALSDGQPNETTESLARDVLRVGKSMESLSHGGTLVVVPRLEDVAGSIDLGRYEPSPVYTLAAEAFAARREIVATIHTFMKKTLDSEEKLSWAERQRTAIARLTAVDGATILDRNLGVLSYGAKLRAQHPDPSSIRVLVSTPFHDAEWLERRVPDLGGTRHQSAATFVACHPRSVALVASQDGGLTLFTWDARAGALLALREAEIVA
jgi:hypothetical protein